MTPTVRSGGGRFSGLRSLLGRFPFITTAVAGFTIGFCAIALWLLPGTLMKGESTVPNVVGLLYADAAARLSAAGFAVKLGESLTHPTAPKSSVLGQTPAPGVKAAKGNEITLDVSLGARKGTVPTLIGLARDAAVKALQAAGFDAPTDVVERIDSRPRGEVLSSTPRAGTLVLQPSSVRLTVSAGPDAIGVPSLIGMPIEDALALLGQLGLTAGPARTDSTSAQPEGFVSAQRPGANSPIAPGGAVTLTVSRPSTPPDSATP